MKDNKPKIICITDGKLGDLNQCLAVADKISDDFKTINLDCKGFLSSLGFCNQKNLAIINEAFNANHFNMVIASGRRTIPYLKTIKNKFKNVFVVYLKDPKKHKNIPDFIWAPEHDRIEARANIFKTHLSPHPWSKRIFELRNKDKSELELDFPFLKNKSPLIAIFLGGDSKNKTWTNDFKSNFINQINKLSENFNGTFLITNSRRTDINFYQELKSVLSNKNAWFWNGEGANPYGAFLAFADYMIVTSDSANMLSEIFCINSPVAIALVPNKQNFTSKILNLIGFKKNNRIDDMVDYALNQKGVYNIAEINSFNLDNKKQIIDETPKIASKVMQAFYTKNNNV